MAAIDKYILAFTRWGSVCPAVVTYTRHIAESLLILGTSERAAVVVHIHIRYLQAVRAIGSRWDCVRCAVGRFECFRSDGLDLQGVNDGYLSRFLRCGMFSVVAGSSQS